MLKKEKALNSADILLLVTAIIWGFAFVAQRKGMEYIGPFLYNGIRFFLGTLTLIPWIIILKKKRGKLRLKEGLILAIWPGIILFIASTFQQIGIIYTTAGNAGFITGLYVIIVPIIALSRKLNSGSGTWVGAIFAVGGLYFLSVSGRMQIARGDLLVFISAFFWAYHVIMISHLVKKIPAEILAFGQFLSCSILSLVAALLFEKIDSNAIISARWAILYGGIMSVGVAYTLQVVAQKKAHPSNAAIILSLEGMFAVIGGWLILAEELSWRTLLGCALVLTGMLISQLSKKNGTLMLIPGRNN